MTEYTVVGFLASGILLVALGYLLLRGKPAIRRMYLVMVLIGLGYLTATGAMEDIGRRILGAPSPIAAQPESEAVDPDGDTPAPAAPAPAAETPPTAPAPANDNAPATDTPEAATP